MIAGSNQVHGHCIRATSHLLIATQSAAEAAYCGGGSLPVLSASGIIFSAFKV
jgi:hypothetical protein